MRLLKSSTHPDLTELAYEQGYYDQAHFIHDFKSYTGNPPSQFIEQHKHVNDLVLEDKKISLDINNSLSLSFNSNLFLFNKDLTPN